MIRSNTDCPYCHDIFDQYCNLFKGYKNCAKSDCEVLKILKENEQLKKELLTYKDAICNRECAEVWSENEKLKQQNKKMQNCWNCAYYKVGDTTCVKGKPHNSGGCYSGWELAE